MAKRKSPIESGEHAHNKKHKRTPETVAVVEAHVRVGTPQEIIAELLGINKDTLERYYHRELLTTRDSANSIVGTVLYNKAVSGDTQAMMFWMKTRGRGWKESVDITNSDGSLKPENVSEAVLAALMKIHDN